MHAVFFLNHVILLQVLYFVMDVWNSTNVMEGFAHLLCLLSKNDSVFKLQFTACLGAD